MVGTRSPYRGLLRETPPGGDLFRHQHPEPEFEVESWSAKGDLETLREAYAGFHPHVRAVITACPEVHKWALVERDPLPRWSEGRVVLLGDACHPMTPYMAQGAATAMEDAAVLSRCLDRIDADGVAEAFRRYEQTRRPRHFANSTHFASEYLDACED
jgi:6-hydroxynicotinate 3-monooxygenase